MLRQPIIRSFFASMLLVIFACSITPRKTLHDLVASHQDSKKPLSLTSDQVSVAGLNCKCDNLVAESPFVTEEVFTNSVPVSFYPADFEFIKVQVLSTFHFFSPLRGPPVTV